MDLKQADYPEQPTEADHSSRGAGKLPGAHIPQTSRDWFNWLTSEENKTVAAYRNKPALLIADFYRERAIARDYEGREILELLQNANDQAAEVGRIGCVVIELSSGGLIVANTGLPFSLDGVVSLQTSHLSPKRRRGRRLIGNKGLGFRSILNWSSTPLILSDALCIGYSTAHSKRRLRNLIEADPELKRLVDEETQGSDLLVLPFLLFPLFTQDGDLMSQLEEQEAKVLFARSEELLVEGFNTVIGMPFDDGTKVVRASEQMAHVRPEVLLFAKNLGELRFRHADGTSTIWKRLDQGDVTEVEANGHSIGKWTIHRSAGQLPSELVDADQRIGTDYEIAVAVPDKLPDDTGLLHSYFATDVALPLPIICHATLDLEQNRKHLQEGQKCNSFVLKKLAELIAEIAESVASQDDGNGWAGSSLLMQRADYPSELRRERFPEYLLEAAKTRRIVPTLGGRAVVATAARRIAGASASWLPVVLFPEVVPVQSAQDVAFLISLDVKSLEVKEIRRRIVESEGLTLDQRVDLILGLLNQESLREAFTSALLVDSSERPLSHGMRVFLPPSGGEAPSLPDWADLRFLSNAMRDRLAQRTGSRDARELQQKLSGFGLAEYSMANVIGALAAEANRAEKGDPENAQSYRTDLLMAILDLYETEAEGKRPQFPERVSIQLPCQYDGYAPAATLYMGSGFGPSGEIVQSLYASWAIGKLIDVQRLPLGIGARVDLIKFLTWIGVARWPREVKELKPQSDFVKFVLGTLKFPLQFEDKVVESARGASMAKCEDVKSVDGLEEMLEVSDPNAISAWLANDDRASAWSKPAPEYMKLVAYPDGVHRARVYQGSVPSYVHWRIANSPWLRSGEGKPLRPKDCVLGERAIEDLFPRPEMPHQEVLSRFGIGQRDVLLGWQRAGVLTNLAFLELDEIYAKLLELPQRSPDGKLARALYHWLLDASDTALGGDGPNRSIFLVEGKMWGHHEGVGKYFPIKSLHHTDVEGLPETLLDKLNIVYLRRRVGAEKVEKIFGVKPVDRAGIKRRIIHREIATGSSQANEDFQFAKPYLHKLRTSQSSQSTQLQVLKDLELVVCSSITAELIFEGAPLTYLVPVWGWMIEDGILSVRADPAKPMELSAFLLADAVGEALASVFRIADGGAYARMISCNDEDRLVLLGRLGGESIIDDFDAIKAEYSAFSSRSSNPALFPIAEPPLISQLISRKIDDLPTEVEIFEPSLRDAEIPGGEPLSVVGVEHIPEPAPELRSLQVKTITSAHPTTRVSEHEITDGGFCERKAMEFEASPDQGRWPLAIGQVMGSDGPGCDVLSFSSEATRELFKSSRDLNTVERFIEVKGRNKAGASIELRGNELSAAERYGNRYYLYRLFEDERGAFQLTILQNPLAHKEALTPSIHVVMQRAKATQRFSLSGGVQE